MGGDIYIHIYTGTLHKSSPSSRIRSTGGTPTRLAACSWAYTCIYYAYTNDLKTRRKIAIRENYLSRIVSVKSLPAISDACIGSTGSVGSKVHASGRPGSPCRHFLPPNRIPSILLESTLQSERSLQLGLAAARRRPSSRCTRTLVV